MIEIHLYGFKLDIKQNDGLNRVSLFEAECDEMRQIRKTKDV